MKKNLIMICIDGCRFDRAEKSFIYKEYMPGTNFCSQSITYAPYTNSSLHAVFSGAYGNRNGCYSYWHSLKFKKENFKTITKYLHEENFFTKGDIHSKLALPLSDFDELEIYDESESDLIDRHKKIIKEIKGKCENKENFFLYLHYEKIHTGLMNYVLRPYTNFSLEYFENIEKNQNTYDDLFKKSEIYLKNILDEINKQNLSNNTLIIIFSDHGTSLGEKIGERAYGSFCYDYTIRTFVSFIHPKFEKNIINQQVRHIDILPTILDIFKIPFDNSFLNFDGESLLPLFTGKEIPEKIAYIETGNPLNEQSPPKKPNTKCVRTSKWKLIFNEYNNSFELYDLQKDPYEKNNLHDKNLDIEKILYENLLKLDQL